MNLGKVVGGVFVAGGAITNQDIIAILGIVIMVLSMIQDYLKEREHNAA